MSVTDLIERTRIAIVSILDSAPALIAITGRNPVSSTAENPVYNILHWRTDFTDTPLPVLLYFIVVASQIGALGDTRDIVVQFTAISEDGEGTVNAMLEVVENVLIAPAFSACSPPLDACTYNAIRQAVPYDSDSGTFRADLTITIRATK